MPFNVTWFLWAQLSLGFSKYRLTSFRVQLNILHWYSIPPCPANLRHHLPAFHKVHIARSNVHYTRRTSSAPPQVEGLSLGSPYRTYGWSHLHSMYPECHYPPHFRDCCNGFFVRETYTNNFRSIFFVLGFWWSSASCFLKRTLSNIYCYYLLQKSLAVCHKNAWGGQRPNLCTTTVDGFQ